jgi:hypothetical protein
VPWLSALLRGRGVSWSSWMGQGRVTSNFIHSNKPAQNQQTSWLTQGWSTFGARKNHGQPRTHKTHHNLDLGEATTFPHIIYSAPPRGSGIRMAFCLGTPKIAKARSPANLRDHNFLCRPPIGMGSKLKL